MDRDLGGRFTDDLGAQLEILRLGARVSARRGDLDAHRRARELAELLLRDAGRAIAPPERPARPASGRFEPGE
jgi:hypothetical protein